MFWAYKDNVKNGNGENLCGSFDFIFSEHEADGETQHILATVEDEVVRTAVPFNVGGGEAVGDIVQTILEREVKEYARDIDA